MQLWGSSRATRDIDIFIEPTESNATRILRGLGELRFGVAREITPEALLRRHVTMIGDTPNVEVLTHAWNVRWNEASQNIVVFEVEDVPVPVISLEGLIASKRTGRAQDIADIAVLEAIRTERMGK